MTEAASWYERQKRGPGQEFLDEALAVVVRLAESFDWRARRAKPHPLRKIPENSYARARETLNQMIDIGR